MRLAASQQKLTFCLFQSRPEDSFDQFRIQWRSFLSRQTKIRMASLPSTRNDTVKELPESWDRNRGWQAFHRGFEAYCQDGGLRGKIHSPEAAKGKSEMRAMRQANQELKRCYMPIKNRNQNRNITKLACSYKKIVLQGWRFEWLFSIYRRSNKSAILHGWDQKCRTTRDLCGHVATQDHGLLRKENNNNQNKHKKRRARNKHTKGEYLTDIEEHTPEKESTTHTYKKRRALNTHTRKGEHSMHKWDKESTDHTQETRRAYNTYKRREEHTTHTWDQERTRHPLEKRILHTRFRKAIMPTEIKSSTSLLLSEHKGRALNTPGSDRRSFPQKRDLKRRRSGSDWVWCHPPTQQRALFEMCTACTSWELRPGRQTINTRTAAIRLDALELLYDKHRASSVYDVCFWVRCIFIMSSAFSTLLLRLGHSLRIVRVLGTHCGLCASWEVYTGKQADSTQAVTRHTDASCDLSTSTRCCVRCMDMLVATVRSTDEKARCLIAQLSW